MMMRGGKSASGTGKLISILNQMSMKLEGKLGTFSRFETKGLERLQTVQVLNSSNNSQKDACSLCH